MTKYSTFRNTKDRNEFIEDKKREGWTNEEISKKVKLSVLLIQNIWKTFQDNKRITRKVGSGRKKTLTRGHKTTIRILYQLIPTKVQMR